MPPYSVERRLKEWLAGARRVVVAGIGNPLRRDDYVGVWIVRKLRNRVSSSVYLLECETVPESFLDPIVRFRPTHILLIDAAILGLEPGSARLIEPHQVVGPPPISTHTLPLTLFCEYVVRLTGARVALLAIQPKDSSLGEGLTPELEETAKQLTEILLRVLP